MIDNQTTKLNYETVMKWNELTNSNSPSAQIEGDSLCLPVFRQANGTLLAALISKLA